ncbi:MAG: hypothetical protein A3E01_02475 [Gammaproteobacteria bacterium RIFCSPHIGHO2_12_FULL_63_22]|nr:MAG: hypothetical protein A3E01_02475 [Gammaproteobacteria bacterium RIFCSPHIGHO2_12_FULL_63_22]
MTTLTRQADRLDARESGIWVTLRYPFVHQVFVADSWIDAALKQYFGNQLKRPRERVAMNIAIGIRAGSYPL